MRALPTNPEGTARRVPSLVPHAVAGAVVVAICTAWALWPREQFSVPPEPSPLLAPTGQEENPSAMSVLLDQSAFHNPIWVTSPAPPPEPKKAPPTPPPRLQLLALSSENGGARAVLYDPDSDRVVTVSIGDRVASSEVKAITRSGVVIADASGSHDLRLDPAGEGRR